MVTTLIVNASPLISLGKIDGLRLLGDPLFKIPQVMPLVSQLQQSGLFIGDRLMADTRTAAGE